ncbi:hypothetical protein pipiens_010717 [Culex pipiens pipiens]|uniref:Uncharacterized protein n=1 Tax=Culex pipiens pipiens TaxID=38569 RepID=A0ABD1D922_CULPP
MVEAGIQPRLRTGQSEHLKPSGVAFLSLVELFYYYHPNRNRKRDECFDRRNAVCPGRSQIANAWCCAKCLSMSVEDFVSL